MLKTKTYKYRLYPTKKQVQKLEWTLDMCRILYNSCLLDRRNHYKQTGKVLSRIKQQEILKSDRQIVESLNVTGGMPVFLLSMNQLKTPSLIKLLV